MKAISVWVREAFSQPAGWEIVDFAHDKKTLTRVWGPSTRTHRSVRFVRDQLIKGKS